MGREDDSALLSRTCSKPNGRNDIMIHDKDTQRNYLGMKKRMDLSKMIGIILENCIRPILML